jgi:hypothetical protein
MSETRPDLRAYIGEHPEFAEIGSRMLEEWEKGAAHSLGILKKHPSVQKADLKG